MRKRKLYLSELLGRYNETIVLQIEIFPRNEGQWIFDNVKQAFDYLTEKYLSKQVKQWEIYNNTIFIELE